MPEKPKIKLTAEEKVGLIVEVGLGIKGSDIKEFKGKRFRLLNQSKDIAETIEHQVELTRKDLMVFLAIINTQEKQIKRIH